MLLYLTKLLVLPICLIQGLIVRKNIVKLPEAIGKREGRVGDGDPIRIMIIGDSAAAGVGVEKQDMALLGQILNGLQDRHNISYKLIAQTGNVTSDVIEALDYLEPETVDLVVTSLGVNDVTSMKGLKIFTQQQIKLIKLLRSKFDTKQVFLSGLPPVAHFPALPQPLRWLLGSEASRFDESLKLIAEENNCHYIDIEFDGNIDVMAIDGFHPGAKVYKRWAEKIINTYKFY